MAQSCLFQRGGVRPLRPLLIAGLAAAFDLQARLRASASLVRTSRRFASAFWEVQNKSLRAAIIDSPQNAFALVPEWNLLVKWRFLARR